MNLAGWTKIADVDTRPNKTGEKWNGQHGVFITDTTGKLGDYRYLLFAVQRDALAASTQRRTSPIRFSPRSTCIPRPRSPRPATRWSSSR